MVSTLDRRHCRKIRALWYILERHCGLRGLEFVKPVPHLSWHIAEDYEREALETVLEAVAASTHPFTIQTSGLGIFTGARPVLYLPVIKDSMLLNMHALLWEHLNPFAVKASPYYAPERWIPHITLGYGDLENVQLGKTVNALAQETFHWTIEIDSLALLWNESACESDIAFSVDLG